jgi:hypothetical protein
MSRISRRIGVECKLGQIDRSISAEHDTLGLVSLERRVSVAIAGG